MSHYDAFPFDPQEWPFPGQTSPPQQAAHPGDSLEPSSSVFGVAASGAPWALDSAVPTWHMASQTNSNGGDSTTQPAAQPSSSSSFLSPLPLPNLSLGPAPQQGMANSKMDHPADALRQHARERDHSSNDALRALMNTSPLIRAGSPPCSADTPGLPAGDRRGTAEGGHAEAIGSGNDASGVSMPAYAHLMQQARFFGPASSHSSPAALETADASASLAPASTYISAPPSNASTPAPPGSAGGVGDQGGLSGSLAAAAAQYGLPLSLNPHQQHHFDAAAHQHQQADQQQQHHFAPPLSLHLNPPTNTPSSASALAFAPPPSFSPAPTRPHTAQSSSHGPGRAGVGHDRPISDTEDSDAGSSGSGSSDSESEDDAPVPYAAHAHLQGVVQDHFTPATSAHHSDHEKAQSPPGGGPLLYGIAPPHLIGGHAGAGPSLYPGSMMAGGGAGEAYDPGAPYIPFLRPSSLSSASSRSLSAGTRHPLHPHYSDSPSAVGMTASHGITYRDDEPPELPYASDDSADGDFGRRSHRGGGSGTGERGRGRTRTRKPSAAALAAARAGQSVAGLGTLGLHAQAPPHAQAQVLGFAAPRPPPGMPGYGFGQGPRSESVGSGGAAVAGPSSAGGSRKRSSPGADALPSMVSGPGSAIDPLTGYPRRQTEIPAVEDDPTIKPYGCNWCRLDRAEARKGKRRAAAAQAYPHEADDGAEDDEEDVGAEETSWRTIKELREHAQKEHKERAAQAKQDEDEAVMMEMPFCCALDPCGKTFKSLAGLRFHFQNASANGHFFVQLERDAATGEERATKKFKQEVKPSGRELKCPVGKCPKRFKQSAGLAYHLSHTPNHPITEAMLSTFEPTLQSKTRWWFGRLNKTFDN